MLHSRTEAQTQHQEQEAVPSESQLQAKVETFIKKGSMNYTQGLIPSIPGLRRLRKRTNGLELKASLGYIVGLRLDSVRPCLKKKVLVILFSFRTVEHLNGKI